MKKLALLFCGMIISICSYAQIGVPQINNYSNLLYKGGTQNWEIDQDQNGIMYFANNEGLLSYNGKYWNLYPLPHKTNVRSIKIAVDGKIYVGGQDEIGYFFPDKNGGLKYHSLKAFIPAHERQFADVWDIVLQQEEAYFRTTSKILKLKDGVFSVYPSKGTWEFLGEANHQVFAQDTARGLLTVKNGQWETVSNSLELKKNIITSVLTYDEKTILITTLKNGLYLFDGVKLTRKPTLEDVNFYKNRIYNAIKVNEYLFAFATNAAGCYIVDKSGKIVQQFSSNDGLQKDNIRCVFKDKNQNLWLGLDNGIDFIAFNNAVKYIYPDKLKQTSSYATSILNNKLYVGTSNGLYFTNLQPGLKDLSFTNKGFSEVKNTQGQVWNLNVIDKTLMVAHEDGTFIVKNDEAQQLFPYPGTWMFESLSTYYPSEEIMAGTYSGLHHIGFKNGHFFDKGEVNGVDDPLRFILYDSNTNSVWASHPYRGIYRFKLSADKQIIKKAWLYQKKDGLPSSLNNYIARIKNRIVVATEKGIYEYDEAKKRFYPSSFLAPILGETLFQYLNEDQYGNIWFVSSKKVGVVDFSRKETNKNYAIVYFPELNSKVVAGFENIYPYDKENVFIGSDKGVIHINYLKYLENIKPLSVSITQVKIAGNKDSILFGGYFLKNGKLSKTQNEDQKIEIAKEFNSLHFEYSSTLYEQQNNIEFNYQLGGFDKNWSDWSAKSEKDYTNLPHGTYTFKVKARNNLGNESNAATYTFTIKPAWYETIWTYIFYLLVAFGIIYIFAERQKRKYEKEQEFLKNQHQLEIEQNEKEIVKLRNDKLEADVDFKNKELATATMHLMQRGKLILKIKEELLPIVKTENIEESPEEFKKILSLIKDAERADTDWEHFSVHFDHVHANFLSKLKEQIPTLSANDLKLCAYLKMNLTSKEIAQLMSVTVRAVEVSRYRLRKKLEVSTDTNLFNYLMEITGN